MTDVRTCPDAPVGLKDRWHGFLVKTDMGYQRPPLIFPPSPDDKCAYCGKLRSEIEGAAQ